MKWKNSTRFKATDSIIKNYSEKSSMHTQWKKMYVKLMQRKTNKKKVNNLKHLILFSSIITCSFFFFFEKNQYKIDHPVPYWFQKRHLPPGWIFSHSHWSPLCVQILRFSCKNILIVKHALATSLFDYKKRIQAIFHSINIIVMSIRYNDKASLAESCVSLFCFRWNFKKKNYSQFDYLKIS